VRAPRAIKTIKTIKPVLAILAASAIVAACGSSVTVEPEVNFALPSTAAGCAGSTTLADGATRVPLTVSTVAGQVAETLDVCIGGRGPYPFVLDTGAGQSTIDARLASRLHLAHDGPAEEFAGVGCTGTAQPVAVPSWSVAGLRLGAQQLTAATLPGIGRHGEPVGLLGSDVLSRFGAVRLDFRAQTLTFAGPEGAAPAGTRPIDGPVGPPPPATLTGGGVGTTVPLTVVLAPGDISLNVRVRFGRGSPRGFVVDTGSSQTVVATFVAKAVGMAGSDLAQRQSTVCSVITVPLVHSGSWSIPGVALHPQLVGETNFGAISSGGIEGLLGSDQLKRYGWVVFDYTGGRMVLG
jgi:hypothetical protein